MTTVKIERAFIHLRSDPEFKLVFTDAVLDFESITQHPDNKNTNKIQHI